MPYYPKTTYSFSNTLPHHLTRIITMHHPSANQNLSDPLVIGIAGVILAIVIGYGLGLVIRRHWRAFTRSKWFKNHIIADAPHESGTMHHDDEFGR